eukprot:g5656.t1 g5656   contig2:991736-993010(+)
MMNNKTTNSGHHPLSQRPVQRRSSANQSELSAAISFLVGDTALNQACALLMAQSDALFGPSSVEPKGVNDTSDAKSSKSSEVSDTESMQQAAASSQSKNLQEGGEHNISTNYTQQFETLYNKCKSAHDTIIRAEQSGILSNNATMTPVASSPYPNAMSTPRMAKGSAPSQKGVILHSMPPPPPALSGSCTSSATPATIRSRGNNPQYHMKRKPSSEGSVGVRSMQRSASDASDATAGSNAERKNSLSAPPPSALEFLKALNNSEAASVTGGVAKKRKEPSPPPSQASTASTSSATAPSTKRPRPPPPPPSNTSSYAGRKKAASSDDVEYDAPESMPPTTPAASTSSSLSGRRSARSASKRASPTANSGTTGKGYDIGQSVLVKVKGEHFTAIVKDVDCGRYEVEFSDGEIDLYDADDLMENDDD